MNAKLGKADGITATAHKLVRILYTLATVANVHEKTVITRIPNKVRNQSLPKL